MADFNFGANKSRPFGAAKTGAARPKPFKVTAAVKKKAAAFRPKKSSGANSG